jgi:hypothetical protein
MSEASKVWRVDVDGREHEVEVDHSTMTGKIRLKLDGEEIADDRLWLAEKPVEFEIAGRPAVVTVEYAYGGFAARSEMHFEGRYVEPLKG